MSLTPQEFAAQSQDPMVILTEFAIKNNLSQMEALAQISEELGLLND